MRALFIMIFTVIFVIGHLISPSNFGYQEEQNIAAAVSQTVPTTESTQNQSTPVPTASAASEENTQDLQTIESPYSTETAAENSTDPESMFGTAKVEDTFERGSSGFGLSAGLNDDENIRIIALNNRLSLEPKKNNGWISWRLRPPSVKDSAVEMEFSFITCARGDRTGIMMRSPDYSSGHGYYFSLSCEGTLSILRDNTVLSTADARGVFKNDSGDVNKMTVIARGNNLTVALNGETLTSAQDDAYAEGFNGFFASPQGQNTLTMDIISFKEYYSDSTN